MSAEDDATCDRVAHGWYAAIPGLPQFRPSGVPECCGAVMRCLGSDTGWDGPREHQTVHWRCSTCSAQFDATFSVWLDNPTRRLNR